MQKNLVDVEANLLIWSEKLKVEERENIYAEHLTSSEVKLEIFVSEMEEMIKNITVRDEFSIQDHHDPLIAKK